MDVNGSPKVIEYNVRMGDPETEVVIPRIKSDFLNLLKGIGDDTFSEKDLNITEEIATTVMLVSEGYPENYEKGKLVYGLENIQNSYAFHAGTVKKENQILTNGGRVISLTSFGRTIDEALKKSYESANTVSFEGKYYRKDIGFDL